MGELIKVRVGSKLGLINVDGEKILDVEYHDIEMVRFRNRNYFLVKKNNDSTYDYGLLDEKGDWVIPCIYQYLKLTDFKYIEAKKFSKWGIIDYENNVIIDFKYDDITCYGEHVDKDYLDENTFEVKLGDEVFLINKEGHRIINIRDYFIKEVSKLYDKIYEVKRFFWKKNNIFVYEKNNKFGLIEISEDEKKCEEIVPPKYDYIDNQYNSGLNCRIGFKHGMIDYQGNETSPCIYEEEIKVLSFSDSWKKHYFLLKLNGKYGLKNNDNEIIIPFEYDDIDVKKFCTGRLFYVNKRKKYGVIDHTGKVIIPPEFDDIYISFITNRFEVYNNKKCALFDFDGNKITNFEYDYFTTF